MGPNPNVTHALNIVVKGIAILYFLFYQTSVLLVEQSMHVIYYNYMHVSISASKISYNDIGWFSNALPYINAFGKLPLSPDHIGTLCHLHTRQNPTKSISLDTKSLSTTHFNGQHKTVFIVHGFHGEENDNWISQMTSALLKEVVSMSSIERIVWRYQRGNQNPYITEEQTTQWPKEKVQRDKQRSTKHTHKTSIVQ